MSHSLGMFLGPIITASRTLYPKPESPVGSPSNTSLGATTDTDGHWGSAPTVARDFKIESVTLLTREAGSGATANLTVQIYDIANTTWRQLFDIDIAATTEERTFWLNAVFKKADGVGGFRVVTSTAGGTPTQLGDAVLSYTLD